MATFACSMFGQILYDDNLTFQELLETEERIKDLMQAALCEYGAQHFDFTAQADSLLMECVFPEMNRENNHEICDSIIRHLGPNVLARFMFMDRYMDSVAFYFMGRGKWHEQALNVPGPKQALSGWVVRQERKSSGGVPARRKLESAAKPGGSASAKAPSPSRNDKADKKAKA